jgi:hypothetical protein
MADYIPGWSKWRRHQELETPIWHLRCSRWNSKEALSGTWGTFYCVGVSEWTGDNTIRPSILIKSWTSSPDSTPSLWSPSNQV